MLRVTTNRFTNPDASFTLLSLVFPPSKQPLVYIHFLLPDVHYDYATADTINGK